MKVQTVLPFLDMVFLSMGALLALMVQMEYVTSIPIDTPQIGPGGAIVERGEFHVVTLDQSGITLNGQPIEQEHLISSVTGERVVLRVERSIATEETAGLLAALIDAGAMPSLEVRKRTE